MTNLNYVFLFYCSLANKQDVSGALDEMDICDHLQLEDLVNTHKIPCRVVCTVSCVIYCIMWYVSCHVIRILLCDTHLIVWYTSYCVICILLCNMFLIVWYVHFSLAIAGDWERLWVGFLKGRYIQGGPVCALVMHKCIMVKVGGKNTRKVCKKLLNFWKTEGKFWKVGGHNKFSRIRVGKCSKTGGNSKFVVDD